MGQQAKALASKPDDMNLTTGTHVEYVCTHALYTHT